MRKLEYLDDYSDDNVWSKGPIYARRERRNYGLGFAREYTPPFRNGRGLVLFHLHLGLWRRTGITDDEEGNLWAMKGSRLPNPKPEEIGVWNGSQNVEEAEEASSRVIEG